MCGIAGVLFRDPRQLCDAAVLRQMADRLSHRGPDGEGIWCGEGIALVHRRLAIIDVLGGLQPLSNEDGSVVVTFNGELYNHHTLRRQLEDRGHTFRTHSDTEVLVHLYEDAGVCLVEQLRGMFAFAIWDAHRHLLLLARDRVGIKPLYYSQTADRVVFGSEVKAVMADPAIEPRVNPEALDDYLTFGFIPGPKSIFTSVRKLAAGHTAVIERRTFKPLERRYWRLDWSDTELNVTREQWTARVREKVDDSVQAHLLADVPVGAFLSAGIDSGIVVASASRHVPALRTFSIGFPPPYPSELIGARRVAERYHTAHTEEVATPAAALDMACLVHHFDEPFADSSAIPTLLVSSLARRSVKVVLSGDGGDESFGGYTRYVGELREHGVRRRIPERWRSGLATLGAAWPNGDWLPRPIRAKSFITNLSLAPGRAYAHSLSIGRSSQRRGLIQPDLRQRLAGYDPYDAIDAVHREACCARDPLRGLLAVDTAVLLPDNYLVKVDRASMACGLEVRPPLLDHKLLELAAAVPSAYKVSRDGTKWVLRQAYRDALPRETLDGPKRGFEMPVDAWFRRELRGAFAAEVLERNAPVHRLLHMGSVEKLFHAHSRGLASHGNLLWAIFVLSHWTEQYEFRV